jgi:hypothetical protein
MLNLIENVTHLCWGSVNAVSRAQTPRNLILFSTSPSANQSVATKSDRGSGAASGAAKGAANASRSTQPSTTIKSTGGADLGSQKRRARISAPARSALLLQHVLRAPRERALCAPGGGASAPS